MAASDRFVKKKLLAVSGFGFDRSTVFKFSEPTGTLPRVLFDALADGSYAKPFLVEDLNYRALCFALDGCTQTEMRLDDPDALANHYTRKMMGFLLFDTAPVDILMIGLGGGALVKYCHRHLPRTKVRAIEIDAEVIAMRAHFHIPADDERLEILEGDGASYVEFMVAAGRHTDVILVDAYDPSGLASAVVEPSFLENTRRILGTRGVFVINIVAPTDDCNRHIETIRRVFGDPVIVIPMPDGDNVVAFAGNPLRDGSRELTGCNARRIENELGLFFPKLLRQLSESQRRCL